MNKDEAIEIAKLLNALIELSAVEKILSTFLSTFKEKSILKDDGYYYLHSSINLGACVSGRMSSPLLMTIPSHSKYAKVIKKCFIAPKGYLMCSANFKSLESVLIYTKTEVEN